MSCQALVQYNNTVAVEIITLTQITPERATFFGNVLFMKPCKFCCLHVINMLCYKSFHAFDWFVINIMIFLDPK